MGSSTAPPSNVIGFDDAPFARDHRGDVLLVGAVFAGLRLEGVLSGRVRRDGVNATRTIVRMVSASRFAAHLQVVLLQGIAVAGFNVVDIDALHRRLGVPVIVVARRPPDMTAIRRALLTRRVPGGRRKWALIERAGPMQPLAGLYVQRIGIDEVRTRALIERLAVHGAVPEPLRTAHLIASGLAGSSRQRV
ncbi:MAG: DUF99 family protein [Gammaproteobacteria bacterium]|nr:DUF99 family protein [Gammaproteobacteria bacterium]